MIYAYMKEFGPGKEVTISIGPDDHITLDEAIHANDLSLGDRLNIIFRDRHNQPVGQASIKIDDGFPGEVGRLVQ